MYDVLDDEFTDIVQGDAVFSGRMLSMRSTDGDKKKNVVRTYVSLQALVKPCNEKTTYQTSGKLAFVQSMMRIYADEEYLHLSVVRRYDTTSTTTPFQNVPVSRRFAKNWICLLIKDLVYHLSKLAVFWYLLTKWWTFAMRILDQGATGQVKPIGRYRVPRVT